MRTSGQLRLVLFAFVLCASVPAVAEAAAGDLISAIPIQAPANMRAWRVVYETRTRDGGVRLSSGVIAAPVGSPPPLGRDVVSWAHPTTGIAYQCSPSTNPAFFWLTPGIKAVVARGYVFAATDYPGLGTPGMHPFLLGDAEGRSVIDIVRAARHIPATRASDRYIVWGHSQGAQAALYAGAIAAQYAPELQLYGVVAAAPPTRLAFDLRDIITTTSGRLLASYALESWSSIFKTPMAPVTNGPAIPVEDLVSKFCLQDLVGSGRLLADFFLTPRMLLPAFWTAPPWRQIVAANSADPHRVPVPLLLFQGTADAIVVPSTTAAFAKAACAAGSHVDFVWLTGGSHDDAGFDSVAPALQWTIRRFDRVPAPKACTTQTIAATAVWHYLF
jgi:alpha-beta hydrolase superfamily lysophospholipase